MYKDTTSLIHSTLEEWGEKQKEQFLAVQRRLDIMANRIQTLDSELHSVQKKLDPTSVDPNTQPPSKSCSPSISNSSSTSANSSDSSVYADTKSPTDSQASNSYSQDET